MTPLNDEILKRFLNFGEWIIETIMVEKFGTSIRIELYFPLNEKFEVIRGEANYRRCVLLFEGIQEFNIHNDLNDTLMDNLDELNWGFYEIAMLKLVNDSEAAKKYTKYKAHLTEYEFRWENERRIHILAARASIEETVR